MAKIRQRIRCPVCGMVNAGNHIGGAGLYPIECLELYCEKSKGKGYGRNKFKWRRYPMPKEIAKAVLLCLEKAIKKIKEYLEEKEWLKEEKEERESSELLVGLTSRLVIPIKPLVRVFQAPRLQVQNYQDLFVRKTQKLVNPNVTSFFVKTPRQVKLLSGPEVVVQRDM